MPEGKEISQFTSQLTIRVTGLVEGVQTIEMVSDGTISGQYGGAALNTLTFVGTNDRGSYTGLGVGYLDSGQAVQGKSTGVYWLGEPGEWETRGTIKLMPGPTLIVEARVVFAARTWSGRLLDPAQPGVRPDERD